MNFYRCIYFVYKIQVNIDVIACQNKWLMLHNSIIEMTGKSRYRVIIFYVKRIKRKIQQWKDLIRTFKKRPWFASLYPLKISPLTSRHEAMFIILSSFIYFPLFFFWCRTFHSRREKRDWAVFIPLISYLNIKLNSFRRY